MVKSKRLKLNQEDWKKIAKVFLYLVATYAISEAIVLLPQIESLPEWAYIVINGVLVILKKLLSKKGKLVK